MTRTYRRTFDRAEQHGTTDTTERRTMLRLASVVGAACDAWLASRGLPSHSWRTDAPTSIVEGTSGHAGEGVTPHAPSETRELFAETPGGVPASDGQLFKSKTPRPRITTTHAP